MMTRFSRLPSGATSMELTSPSEAVPLGISRLYKTQELAAEKSLNVALEELKARMAK